MPIPAPGEDRARTEAAECCDVILRRHEWHSAAEWVFNCFFPHNHLRETMLRSRPNAHCHLFPLLLLYAFSQDESAPTVDARNALHQRRCTNFLHTRRTTETRQVSGPFLQGI